MVDFSKIDHNTDKMCAAVFANTSQLVAAVLAGPTGAGGNVVQSVNAGATGTVNSINAVHAELQTLNLVMYNIWVQLLYLNNANVAPVASHRPPLQTIPTLPPLPTPPPY